MKHLTAVRTGLVAALLLMTASAARADAVTDWNARSHDIVVGLKMATPPANRAIALTQAAVFEAVNAITRR